LILVLKTAESRALIQPNGNALGNNRECHKMAGCKPNINNWKYVALSGRGFVSCAFSPQGVAFGLKSAALSARIL